MRKLDPYKYGAKEICLKCETPLSFYPADGKKRKATLVFCEKCSARLWELARWGNPTYWTGKLKGVKR